MTRIMIQFGRSKLILGLIIGMGLVAGYLGYSQADDPTTGILLSEPNIKASDLEIFKNFKMEFSIFDDERFKALEIYGENPVDPGIIGERTNPFEPLGQ